jgi:hypothetical protein
MPIIMYVDHINIFPANVLDCEVSGYSQLCIWIENFFKMMEKFKQNFPKYFFFQPTIYYLVPTGTILPQHRVPFGFL